MHRCSVFKNACVNVPVDPISRMPKTAYERNEKTLIEQCSIESSCCSVSADIEAEKLKDFYRSIPDYNEINHLSEAEFYSTLKSLRDKKKLMLGLAVEHIDDCKLYNDSFDKEENASTIKKHPRPIHRRTSLTVSEKPKIPQVNVTKVNRPIRKIDGVALENAMTSEANIDSTKTSSLSVKGVSKMDRPKRNHSACSISWHDDKVESRNEVDDKFDKFFEGNKYPSDINDDGLYKTQSMPSSPLRTRRSGSLRRRKSITIPKPFKMTERDEEDRIVSELRGLQKSLSEDMLHQKRERKRFRAKPVPIESRIPLYDKILEDQAMRRAITKINSEAELRAQMKPFSFTKREEGCSGVCERAVDVLPKCKKKRRFRARPVPKNLFSNYFYDKIKEDNFFRSMNRRVRAEEMLRNSSFPGNMAARDRSRLSTPAAHSDLPIDPSPAVPSITSSDRHRCSSPTKDVRKSKAKEDFITTSPQPFRFNTAERASKKMNDITKKIYQDTKSTDSRNGTIEKTGDIFNKTQAYSALDLKGITAGRSNLAAVFRAEAVRQKFEMESARRLAEQRRRAENRQRDRLLRSKPAWHLVKNNHEEDIAMRLQTRRDEERMRREEFLHEMELMYGRVQQQPMLFERYYAPRSGATTEDSIQLSPRKSPSKKRGSRNSKSYHSGSPCFSPELRGDLLKYLDKKSCLTEFYDDRVAKENLLDSLERS